MFEFCIDELLLHHFQHQNGLLKFPTLVFPKILLCKIIQHINNPHSCGILPYFYLIWKQYHEIRLFLCVCWHVSPYLAWPKCLFGVFHKMALIAFFVVQLLSHDQLFATPWTAACQASLSFTISGILLKLMSIESVMPSNFLFFCHPFLLLPSIFPSISVFSNESALHQVDKYWSFSFTIISPNEYSELISFRIDWFDLL